MIRSFRYAFYITLSAILGSCATPSMFISTSQNVPLLSEKGEGKLTVEAGTAIFGIKGAYALSNHIATFASGSAGLTGPQIYVPDIKYDKGKRFSAEAAAGYFDTINKNCVIEFYGGFEGYNRSYYYEVEHDHIDEFKTNIYKPFLQLDFGILGKNRAGIGFSGKMGYMIYDQFMNKRTYFQQPKDNYTITENPAAFCFEPAITCTFGLRNFNVQFQVGTTFSETFTIPYDDNKVFVNLGLIWHFWNGLNSGNPSRSKKIK